MRNYAYHVSHVRLTQTASPEFLIHGFHTLIHPHKEILFYFVLFLMQLLQATTTFFLSLDKPLLPKGTFVCWGGFLNSFATTIPPSPPYSTHPALEKAPTISDSRRNNGPLGIRARWKSLKLS